MKRLFLFFFAMMLCSMLTAQTMTQQGISYRYNGKKPRTPLPNVTIECNTANNAVISDSAGTFTLTFNKLKMGDRMGTVTIRKREMMVFNQQAVDEWSIRKEPLCLILCDANEFENQKQELINIGKREAQKKYNRQKAELEQQLADNQIDRTRYEAKLDSAWQELDRLHKHIDEYADLFARIDESEIDTLAQQAMDLFNQGMVDEAVRLFEQGNYLEKLKADNRTIQQAENMIETASQVKSKAEEEKKMHLHSLNAQVEAYKMQNEWGKAGTLLKDLANELNTYESLNKYATFCDHQNDYKEAELYYLKTLQLIQQSVKGMPHANESALASASYNLAVLYNNTQRYSESEIYFQEALQIFRRIAKDHLQNYKLKLKLAQTLNGIGIMYRNTQRFSESEACYQEAIQIFQDLVKNDPNTYESQLAGTLNNLAILYRFSHRYQESIKTNEDVLIILSRLAKENPLKYEPQLAMTLNNLAVLYEVTQRFKESEEMYMEAQEIRARLANDNPKAYEPDLATTLYNHAGLYKKMRRLKESEDLYLQSLEIRRRLAKDNPKVYEPDLAITLNGLALLYSNTNRLSESESMYLEALEIYKQLAKNNPQVFEPVLAKVQNNLGSLYCQTKRYTESESIFLESLEIRRRLAKEFPQTYEPDLASILNNLANLYSSTQRLKESEMLYLEAIIIRKRLADIAPTIYQPDLITSLGSISFMYIFKQEYVNAEQYAREALSISPTKHWICPNLAASLLFQGRYDEAEAVYRQYKDELKDSFLQDFDDFEAAGVIPEGRKADVERIRKMLTEEY